VFNVRTLKLSWLSFFTLLLLILTVPACKEENRPTAFPGLETSKTPQTLTPMSTATIVSSIPTSTPTQAQLSPTTLQPYPTPPYTVHTVKPGETLGQIAKQHGVSVEILVTTNNLVNPNLIRVGQEILIPQSTTEATPLATGTPAPQKPASYGFILPKEIRSNDGWVFTIHRIDLLHSIDGILERYGPENGIFLVMIGTVSNFTDQNGCIYGGDFLLHAGAEQYAMRKEILNAAKNIYDLDYPGFFLGQCVDYDKTVESYLVFDIPIDGSNLRLQIKDTETPIGQIPNFENR
jgi:LysM repeat protein